MEPDSPLDLDDFDSTSRSQFAPASPFLRPVSVLPFPSYVVSIVKTVQNVFTFCFCLRMSASLKNYRHDICLTHIYQAKTYRSFRTAKLVALSFGFLALAFFFWAFSRACSRWFPPRAPREDLKEMHNELIRSVTYESLVVYTLMNIDTGKNGFESGLMVQDI